MYIHMYVRVIVSISNTASIITLALYIYICVYALVIL